jgi:phospholipase C
MNNKNLFSYSALGAGIALALNCGTSFAAAPITRIEHVIVVIGENVSFDTLYGAYKPEKCQKNQKLTFPTYC